MHKKYIFLHIILLQTAFTFCMDPEKTPRKSRLHRNCHYDKRGDTLIALALETIKSSYSTEEKSHPQSIHRENMRKPGIEILETAAVNHKNSDAQFILWFLFKHKLINMQNPATLDYYAHFDVNTTPHNKVRELTEYVDAIKANQELIKQRIENQSKEKDAYFRLLRAFKE